MSGPCGEPDSGYFNAHAPRHGFQAGVNIIRISAERICVLHIPRKRHRNSTHGIGVRYGLISRRRCANCVCFCGCFVAGIYLFTKGFPLTRLALLNRASCLDEPCARLATYKCAAILVIDVLWSDFVSDNPPESSSLHHHHVLTLPRESTAAHPHHFFIFNAHADPPKTPLQRIKGLTTGFLPTRS